MGLKQKTPGKIRIIGGQWRGAKLTVPDYELLRPTPDRVRETLFNWLRNVIQGSTCLDLFAGSGALGFEAASRGAAKVVMIERNRNLAELIRRQAESLQSKTIDVFCADALKWLESTGDNFDMVFLDPPFGQGLVSRSLSLLSGNRVLRTGALIYVESEAELAVNPDRFQVKKQSRAGQVQYMLLEQRREQN